MTPESDPAAKLKPEGKPPEGKPPEGKPPEGKPPEGKPPEGKPPEGKPPEGKPPEGKPPEGKPPEGKPPKPQKQGEEAERKPRKRLTPPTGKRTAQDTVVKSLRLTHRAISSMAILEALDSKKTDVDRYSDIIIEAAERLETTPPAKFQTLNVADFTKVKGETAELLKGLNQFFEKLADVEIHPDDEERTEAIAVLAEETEIRLHSASSILERMAALSFLPKAATTEELKLLLKVIPKLNELEEKAPAEDKPMFALLRKIAGMVMK